MRAEDKKAVGNKLPRYYISLFPSAKTIPTYYISSFPSAKTTLSPTQKFQTFFFIALKFHLIHYNNQTIYKFISTNLSGCLHECTMHVQAMKAKKIDQ